MISFGEQDSGTVFSHELKCHMDQEPGNDVRTTLEIKYQTKKMELKTELSVEWAI